METLTLNAFLAGFGRMSLEAGVLVVLVLGAQGLFRQQLTPRWRCTLWLLVVMRLLLPVSFTSAASLFNLLPAWTNHAAARSAPGIVAVAASPVPAATTAQVSTPPPLHREPQIVPIHGNAGADPAFPGSAVPQPPPAPRADTPPAARPNAISWGAVLFGAWLVGALVLMAHVGFTSVRLARRITKLAPIHDPAVRAVLDECRGLVGVATPLEVVATDQVAGPALHGLWRPRLLLPRRCLADFSPGELRFIFLHELAHLKRRDLLMNWLVALLQAAHWFNPLLWLGFARWRADRELACDALALEAAGAGQNRDYGRTILRLLEGFTQRAAVPGLVGILEDQRQLRRRIQMIATYVPTRRWTILAMVLMAVLAVTGLTDAQSKAAAPDKAKAKFSGAASLETQSSTKPAPPSRPIVTNGPAMKVMVLDQETGQPLPDAEVLAPNFASFFGGSENAPRWTTAADGAAVIRLGEVPPNHLREISWFAVSIRHAGYSPRSLSWSAENKDVRPDMPREITVRLERGITLGGAVRDEAGVALSGIRVRVFACGYSYAFARSHERHQEYAEFGNDSAGGSLALTDAQGRWQVQDFPRGLENVAVQFLWPDGAMQTFKHTAEELNPISNVQGESIDLAGLRAGDAAFVLKSGLQLHGIVRDPEGRPLPGVLVKTGLGAVNMRRLLELHTDTAGRFELSHLTRGQVILTAYPKDFAVTSTIADVTTNTPEVRLQVAPLRPLRVRVLDGAGQAVAGAKLSLDGFRTRGQVLDFSGIADQEGRLTWSNAPVSSFALVASAPVSGLRQKIRLAPEQREATFRLRQGMDKEVVVHGRVHDSKTGAAVELESVRYQTMDFEDFRFEAEIQDSTFRLTVPATRFRPGGMYPTFQLQLEAKGYGTLITPWRDFDEGDWEPDFALHPASESGVTLSLPDGKPAAGARVWTFFDEGTGPLVCISPNQFYGVRGIKVQADANGQFAIPTVPDDRPVVFTHRDGFLETSIAEAKRSHAVRLQPWGRVEGVLRVAGQPKADARVSLSTLLWSPSAGLVVLYSTATTADGRFLFTNVPAGEYKLYRQVGPVKYGPITESYQMPITVKAGETLKVAYASEGRTVIGLAQADPPDAPVNWLNDDHVLVLKQAPPPEVNLEDFATTEAFQKARIASYASPARLQQARNARTYQIEFQSDGSFRANDVPPGKYELRIRVTKPEQNRQINPFPRTEDELGSLVREVVVPQGRGPFDLGTLTVPIKGEAGTPRTAPLELSAQTLDGQPVSLAQFKGKHVLVVFWAAWSERSLDALAELQKLQTRLAQDGRLAFLGVNVGDETAKARQVIDAGGYRWTQARLSDAERAQVTAAFDVNTLPAVLLLDPNGRLVGRDLEGERLQTAVQRALSKRSTEWKEPLP